MLHGGACLLQRPDRRVTEVGVISDTHGLLRPEALDALGGVELIVHAGDVGDPQILDALREVAPVRAVRGNVDHGTWARALPETDVVEVEGVRLYVLHDLGALDLDPRAAGFGAVVSGHSHQPVQQEKDGVLYLNPGSAGPRRFKLPVTLARVVVDAGQVRARLVELLPTHPRRPARFVMSEGLAIQDRYPSDVAHCFGCGSHNPEGHRLRTFTDGDATVSRFTPAPHHTAIPGYVYGGLIASLIDCHGNAAASAALAARDQIAADAPMPRFVTASLHVDYLKPTPLGPELEVRGAVAEMGERKVVVDVTLAAEGVVTARGRVVSVRMPASMVRDDA